MDKSIKLSLLCFIIELLMPLHITAQSILTGNQNKTVNLGDTVQFDCIVTITSNINYLWKFIKEDSVLSENTRLLGNTNKYAVSHTSVEIPDLLSVFTLQINDVTLHDEGVYQCAAQNEDGSDGPSQLFFLYVTGSVSKPDPIDLPPANFTDCCVSEGVSTYCQTVCSPSTFEAADFDTNQCALDLRQMIKCGADGKNHASCCSQRQLPSFCFDYCRGVFPDTFDSDEQTICLGLAEDILSCFVEGQHIIPSAPLFPLVLVMSSSEVLLSWQHPATDVTLVTGYKVFTKQRSETHYGSTSVVDSSTTSLALQDLQPATHYRIYVISIGHHGTSQPSVILDFITESGILLPPGTDELQLLECCKTRRVSLPCQSFLCGGTYVDVSAADKLACYSHVDALLTCLAGEKDHSDCCTQRGIEDRCLPLCTGQVSLISSSFEFLDCFERMPEVASCIQENRGVLANPPTNLHITDVTFTSAQVTWQAADDLYGLVLSYLVEYKTSSETLFNRVETESLEYLLHELLSGTEYEVRLSSQGEYGYSLPTASYFFLTYFQDGTAIMNNHSD